MGPTEKPGDHGDHACPKCGTIKKTGKLSCCAPGGSWFKNCGNPGDKKYSWSDGMQVCSDAVAPPITGSPGHHACPKCGTIKKSGKKSCCAPGGSWFKNCGNPGDKKVQYTWSAGMKVCSDDIDSPIPEKPEKTTGNPDHHGCSKCGTIKKTGKKSCCAPGGAWFKDCGDTGDAKFHHTWADGIKSCFFPLDAQVPCTTCGVVKGSNKRSCCAPGGSWYLECGDNGDANFPHTWYDGIRACPQSQVMRQNGPQSNIIDTTTDGVPRIVDAANFQGYGNLSKITFFISILLIVLHLQM